MAATVGELAVALVARTAAFAKGMRQSGRNVTTFGNKVGMAAKRVATFGKVMAALAVSLFAREVKRAADEMDRMAKVSRKIGLAVEELVALRHAADLAGIGANTLDMALQRMTRRVAEAAIGTGEAQAAIKELGLDAKKLAVGGTYEAMLRIAEALHEVKAPADRLRLAFKLFDSEGAELVNITAQGAEGLKEIKKRTDELSGVTQLAAKQIEGMNDAFTELWMRAKSLPRMTAFGIAAAGSELGVWGEPLAKTIEKLKKAKAATRELAEATLAAQKAVGVGKQRESGEKAFGTMQTDLALSGASAAQKRIALWMKEARAVGMARGEVWAFGIAMNIAADAQDKWAARDKARRDTLRQRGQDIAGQMNLAKSLIGQQVRGGDGVSLSGADPMGSAGAYSAMVHRGLQSTGKKTDEEILRIVKEQLKEDRDTNQKIGELLGKMDFGVDDVVEIR